jgi:methionyl-tRNA formyltransferase
VRRGRVVLAGNNAAAVDVLDLLLEAVTPDAVLAVAPPGAPSAPWQRSLAAAAAERGVECLTPSSVNDAATVARVRDHRADILLSVYYTQLFGPELIAAVEGPLLNFHPSLLPRHRGHAPLIWAVVEGDSVTGLSVHHIDSGIDTGPLLYQRSLPIHPLDTGYDLHQKMRFLVRAAAAELLRSWVAGEPLPEPLEQTGVASVHSLRDPQVNHLSWTDSRERIRNIVRALAPPLPGAFVEAAGRRLVIAAVEPAGGEGLPSRPAGMVDRDSRGYPLVWAADGPVRLLEAWDAASIDARELELPTGTVLR